MIAIVSQNKIYLTEVYFFEEIKQQKIILVKDNLKSKDNKELNFIIHFSIYG